MKQEIKGRVERIRNVEVPEGYKKTKVGIIPDDWEVKKLAEVADVKTGPFGSALHEKDYVKDGTPIITVEHLGEQGVVHDNLPMVSDFDRNRLKSYVLKTGDIVFSRVGSVDRNSLIKETENGWLFSGRLLRIRVTTANISPSYLSYHFHQEITKQKIRSVAVGQTMASLNTQILKDIHVSFPPTRPEQQKIVEILSTWDKAIELKEKLITEINEFKRGLMQKLLTGKIRFSEFNDEWEEIPLSNIVNRITSKNNENNQTVITISAKEGFVNQDEYFNKLVASKDLSGYFLIKKGDFAYNKSYSNGYPGGAIKRLDSFENAVVTTLYICFRIEEENVSSDFLKYYFDSGLLNRQIKRIANEGGRAHGLLNVTPNNFFNIKVNLPEYEEQKKISKTLLANGQDIQLLEMELFELKEQKKGLMQLLLTGIVRVNT